MCKAYTFRIKPFVLNIRTPVEFQEIALPEKLWTQVAILLRDRFNWAFGVFWEVASGKNLKKFFLVPLSLPLAFVLSIISCSETC